MFRTNFNGETKLWSGEPNNFDWNQKTSLGIEILNSLKMYGLNVAQICAITGNTKTFEELRVLTVRAAINLQQFGCVKGKRILVYVGNVPEIVPMSFGAICLGCSIVPILTSASQAECEYFMNLTKPEFAVCHIRFYSTLRKCFKNLKINAKNFTVDGQIGDSISVQSLFERVDNEPSFEPAQLDPVVDSAFILRTSGTTGLNKAICVSHASVLHKIKALNGIFCPSDVMLKFMCFDGMSGIRCLLGATLNGSTQIVNTGLFSPPRFFELAERFRATVTHTSAYMVVQMLKDPGIETANLSSFRIFQCGGSNISFQIIQKFGKYLKNGKFCITYGLTESFSTIASNMRHSRNNCVGQLISGYAAKIVNDQGERLGVNGTGELCVKFPFPFPGYLNATQDTACCVDEEGFFLTGDEGRFDENGDLFIDDRRREMFKCRGCRVSPAEMEAFLNNIEGVKHSCVVPIPAEKVGYVAAAVIVKDKISTCTEHSLYDAVKNHFANYKRLEGGVYFIDAMPMTGSGKISRHLVKRMAVKYFNETNNNKKQFVAM